MKIGDYVYIWRGNTPDGTIQEIVTVRAESTEIGEIRSISVDSDNPDGSGVQFDMAYIVPIDESSQFDPFWVKGKDLRDHPEDGWYAYTV